MVAVRVQRRLDANLFDRVEKEVAPNWFMQPTSICLAKRRTSRDHTAVGSLGIPLHIGRGDQAASRLIRRRMLIDVDKRPQPLQTQQLPRSAIVIAAPAIIQRVREPKVTLQRRRRG